MGCRCEGTIQSVFRIVLLLAAAIALCGCAADSAATRVQQLRQKQRDHQTRLYAKAREMRSEIINSDLPADVKAERLARIDRIMEDYERDIRELGREAREQDMIDAQTDLADAIRGLSDQVEQRRY